MQTTEPTKPTLAGIAARITTDFEYFCRMCLTIPARNWRVAPSDTTIDDIPFVLSQHQREYIAYLERKDIPDKVVLKTRQRGYSVVTVAYMLWLILYGRNENITYLMHSGDDAKQMSDLIKFMYASIPPPFKPEGMKFRSQPQRLHNSRWNNKLLMKTAGIDSGRSSTLSRIVLDEISSYDTNIQEAIAAAINASCPNNRIWISTPKKENDIYHDRVKTAELEGTLWKHGYWDYVDDWFGSKEMAETWRPALAKGLTTAQIAREMDCQFKGAVEDTIWYTEPHMWAPYTSRRKDARCIVSLDLGYSDDTAILWARDYGNYIHVIDELNVKETTTPQIVDLIQARGHKLKYGICDSSGKGTDMTSGHSSWKYLERGLHIKFKTKKFPDKIEMLRISNRELILKRVVIDSARCPFLTEMLNNYEWTSTDKMPHNHFSHVHDSFVYLVYNWLKAGTKSKGPRMVSRGDLGVYI